MSNTQVIVTLLKIVEIILKEDDHDHPKFRYHLAAIVEAVLADYFGISLNLNVDEQRKLANTVNRLSNIVEEEFFSQAPYLRFNMARAYMNDDNRNVWKNHRSDAYGLSSTILKLETIIFPETIEKYRKQEWTCFSCGRKFTLQEKKSFSDYLIRTNGKALCDDCEWQRYDKKSNGRVPTLSQFSNANVWKYNTEAFCRLWEETKITPEDVEAKLSWFKA